MNNKKFLPLIVIITLVIGFGGGIWYSHAYNGTALPTVQNLINQSSGQPKDVDFSLFWTVWNDLQQKYVDKSQLNDQNLVYGAIEGMVNSVGDPYTVFFPPAQATAFSQEISGAFGGVGLEVGEKNNILTVISPIKGTPGYNAGIVTGDEIIKINGTPTAGEDADVAVNSIRGDVGTKVTLTITDTKGVTKDIVLTRETINVPTVEWKMISENGKNIAYIQAYEFNANIDDQFKTAVTQIEQSNPKADGIILDLRDNPGGLLDSAINLAGYFLQKNQLVVSEVFGDGTKNQYTADGTAELAKYPTVILVNGGSASASEILSGALHDDLHIKLIGVKTFGKGVVQELENLSAGSSFKVTVARWFTPAGVNIQKQGIEPDINVPLTDAQTKALVVGDPANDPQLQKALDTLTK